MDRTIIYSNDRSLPSILAADGTGAHASPMHTFMVCASAMTDLPRQRFGKRDEHSTLLFGRRLDCLRSLPNGRKAYTPNFSLEVSATPLRVHLQGDQGQLCPARLRWRGLSSLSEPN